MSPRVSVVIPSYNNGDFIEEAVESVLGQTYADFELVVSDHSSQDDTWERLQKYADDPRVRLLQTPAGGGAPANWRAVTDQATGELIKLVCGDDIIAADCLEAQVRAIDTDDRIVMVAAKRDLIDARGGVVLSGRGLAGLEGQCSGRKAARRTVVVGANIFGEPACVLMRRSALTAVGGWSSDHPYVIDQQTYCNVLSQGDFYGVGRSLARFRMSAGQWSVNLAKDQSDQVVGFHHALAHRQPGLLSRKDLLIGDTRARLMAFTRRLAYLWVGRRMHAEP